MKVRIEFVSKCPKERISSLTIGKYSIRWKKIRVCKDKSTGIGVLLNNEPADDKIDDIKGLKVKSVEVFNPENKQTRSDVSIKSIIFIDNTEVYSIPKICLPKESTQKQKKSQKEKHTKISEIIPESEELPRVVVDEDIVNRDFAL